MQDWKDSEIPEQPGSWAFRLALCLLGPIFYLSYLLVIAPLPLLYLHSGSPSRKSGLVWTLIASILGSLLCAAVKGWLDGLGFLALAVLPAWLLGEFLLRKQGPEKAIFASVSAVLLAFLLAGSIYANLKHQRLVPAVETLIEEKSKSVAEWLLATQNDLPEENVVELKKMASDPAVFATESVPGAFLFTIVLLSTLPCLAIIRWNPKGFLRRAGIARDFLRKWRSPDWLASIGLCCALFAYFVHVKYLSILSVNLLKPILLIYFFHGMSILAFFLDSLRLRGPIRAFYYGAGILFLAPMIMSFGFFDLWFNFRGRQKAQEEEDAP